MLPKKRLKKKSKLQPIQITEKDGTKKIIGKFDPEKKLFICDRKKSEHFMRKYGAWGLDQKVVEFLILQRAKVHLKDTESKWEYECDAVDFTLHGKIEEFNQHRPQYFLPLSNWEVVKITNRSMVIECKETDCRHNFANQCMRGVIRIGDTGECEGYEDRTE
jgi:hypothetical protein